MTTVTTRARARIYSGMWIADCPEPYCGNAEKLTREAAFHCSNCQLVVEVEWPDNPDELMAVLARRRVPQTRNWFPADHHVALASNTPHGQTVADLEAENREYGID